MKLLRSMGLVGGIKILAKISAVFRDRAIALTLGTGAGADMFFLGFNVTGGLRGMVAEEPLKASFLPLFAEAGEQSRQDAWDFVNTVVNTVLAGLALLAVAWLGAVPAVIRLVSGGGTAPALAAAATAAARMLAVTLVFGGASTISVSVLTVMGRFAVPAALPLVMNVLIIFTALFLHPWLGAGAVALGVVAGSVCQVAVQLPLLLGCGYRYRPVLRWRHPRLRQMGALFVPVMLMQGLVQVNIVIDTAFAAGLEPGSISYLYYGNRIMLFPYEILALAVTMVAFPALAKSAAHHDTRELAGVLDTALGMVIFFSLPALAGGLVLARPLVQMLFGGVMHGDPALAGTARALAFFMIGMPAFIAVRVLLPVFYSLKDTRLPLLTGVFCLGLNILFDYLLIGPLGFAGLALSSSLAAAVNTLLLVALLRRKNVVPAWRMLGGTCARSAAGALLTGAGVWQGAAVLARYGVVVQAGGAVCIGVLLYAGIMRLFRNRQLALITAAVRGE